MNLLGTTLTPLDRARGAFVRAAAGSWLRPFVVSRDRRIALQATLGVGIALAIATLAPLPMFALSPILLGIPHVAADERVPGGARDVGDGIEDAEPHEARC